MDGEHFTGMGVGRIDFELQKLSFIQRLVDPGFHTKCGLHSQHFGIYAAPKLYHLSIDLALKALPWCVCTLLLLTTAWTSVEWP